MQDCFTSSIIDVIYLFDIACQLVDARRKAEQRIEAVQFLLWPPQIANSYVETKRRDECFLVGLEVLIFFRPTQRLSQSICSKSGIECIFPNNA